MPVEFAQIVKSLGLFVLAGLAEIGGGYLVWQWLREGKGILLGIAGVAILFLYGIIPTFQTEAAFGRVYAAYGVSSSCLRFFGEWSLIVGNPTALT